MAKTYDDEFSSPVGNTKFKPEHPSNSVRNPFGWAFVSPRNKRRHKVAYQHRIIQLEFVVSPKFNKIVIELDFTLSYNLK